MEDIAKNIVENKSILRIFLGNYFVDYFLLYLILTNRVLEKKINKKYYIKKAVFIVFNILIVTHIYKNYSHRKVKYFLFLFLLRLERIFLYIFHNYFFHKNMISEDVVSLPEEVLWEFCNKYKLDLSIEGIKNLKDQFHTKTIHIMSLSNESEHSHIFCRYDIRLTDLAESVDINFDKKFLEEIFLEKKIPKDFIELIPEKKNKLF